MNVVQGAVTTTASEIVPGAVTASLHRVEALTTVQAVHMAPGSVTLQQDVVSGHYTVHNSTLLPGAVHVPQEVIYGVLAPREIVVEPGSVEVSQDVVSGRYDTHEVITTGQVGIELEPIALDSTPHLCYIWSQVLISLSQVQGEWGIPTLESVGPMPRTVLMERLLISAVAGPLTTWNRIGLWAAEGGTRSTFTVSSRARPSYAVSSRARPSYAARATTKIRD